MGNLGVSLVVFVTGQVYWAWRIGVCRNGGLGAEPSLLKNRLE